MWLSPLPNSKIKQTNSGETATAATRNGKKKPSRWWPVLRAWD